MSKELLLRSILFSLTTQFAGQQNSLACLLPTSPAGSFQEAKTRQVIKSFCFCFCLCLGSNVFWFLRSHKACCVSLPQHYTWQIATETDVCPWAPFFLYQYNSKWNAISEYHCFAVCSTIAVERSHQKKKKRRTMVHKSNFPLVRERLRGEPICSVDACTSDTGYLRKKRKSPR